jgi:HEAT repeat protein
LIGSAAVVLVAGGYLVKRHGVPVISKPETGKSLAAEQSMKELRESAKSDPKDATVRLAMGHKLYKAKKHDAALRSYEYALDLDGKVGDEEMMRNLVASYRDPTTRAMAQQTIVSHKLVKIEDHLDDLASDADPEVRAAALATLEKLGRRSVDDELAALALDIKSPDCKVRQRAVERLGQMNDARALPIVKEAAQFDQKNSLWHKQIKNTCLGDRAVFAERRLAAVAKESQTKMVAKK